MPAKKVESFRQKEGDKKVIRLLHTQPLLDDKWIPKGVSRDSLKKYVVLSYDSKQDVYLPVFKLVKGKKKQWWDKATHDLIKGGISGYDDKWERKIKNRSKLKHCSDQIKKTKFTFITTDDWDVAQSTYIEWCKKDGVEVTPLTAGGLGGDD